MMKKIHVCRKEVLLTMPVFLFALLLTVDTIYACCIAIPIDVEDATIIGSSESNTIVKISYRNFVAASAADPDSLLKEKTVSTADMIADLANRYASSTIVTIGEIHDVESYYSEFDAEGRSFHRERIQVTFDRVLKGDLAPGSYEFTYTLWGDERQLVYDSTTGETDTIFSVISLPDPGYGQLIGKTFLHFANVENPQTADYAAYKPDPCRGLNGFFLDDNQNVVFTGLAFRDTNDFTYYPLLSVPIETFMQTVNTLSVDRNNKKKLHTKYDSAPNGPIVELYTITGRRVPMTHNTRNIQGAAAGLYLRRGGSGSMRQKNLLIGSGNTQK